MIEVGDMVECINSFYPRNIYIVVRYHKNSQTFDLFCPEYNRYIWEDSVRLNSTDFYRKLA